MDGGTDGRVPHRVRVHACVRTHTVCVAPTLGIGILESAALAGMAPEEQGRRQMHLAYSGMPDLGAARESLLDGALTPCRNGHAGSACTVGRSTSSPRPMREVSWLRPGNSSRFDVEQATTERRGISAGSLVRDGCRQRAGKWRIALCLA